MKGILWAELRSPLAIGCVHPNGKPHHVTLKYDIEAENCPPWLGFSFMGVAVEHVWNDKAQALLIELPGWVEELCSNQCPHLTVSWADGFAPAASNVMLETREGASSLPFYEVLEFEICFHPFEDQGESAEGILNARGAAA
jgi:hypothetical protein